MILRIQKSRWTHTRFYLLYSVLVVLLFVRYGLEVDIPRIVLTGTIALIALLGDRNEILAISMCCIPLHEAVDFFYALVACAGVFVIKYHRDIRVGMGVFLTLIMIVWELLHCFTADFSIMGFLVSVIPLIFLAVILCIDVSRVDYAFIVRTMSSMVAIMSLILMTNLVVRANYDFAVAIDGLQRLGFASENSDNDTMLGGLINPNSLGIICVLSSTGLLQLRAVGSNRATDNLLLVILLVFGTLTSSRTFFVCLVLMGILLVMAQPGDLRKKGRLLAALTLVTVITLILMNWLFPSVLEYYIGRFAEEDITTGRDTLMTAYHRFIIDNLSVMFSGVGLQNFGTKLLVEYRVAHNLPHNGFQELIVAWGIPGLLLFILLCVFMVLRSRKTNKDHILLNFIPFIIIITKSMAGQLLTSGYTMLAMVYAYLSLCQEFRPIEERNRSFILQSPQTLSSYDARDDLLNNKTDRGG